MSDLRLPTYTECFVCGTAETGLGVQFCHAEDGSVVARDHVFKPLHQGFTGVVHGGTVPAGPEAISGWAARLAHGDFVMTQDIAMSFKRMIKIGSPYLLHGWFVESKDGTLIAEGAVKDAAGAVYASCRSVFRPMPARMANPFAEKMSYIEGGATSAWRKVHPIPAGGG